MTPDQKRERTDLSDAYTSPSVAKAWQRGVAARAGALGPVTERMLSLAGVEAGSHVLDIAAGTGEQTLMAARRVGPDGLVLAVDIAPEMLQVAADEARTAGLANVETRIADAQALDVTADSFDSAICRSGLMLMRDPVAALVGIYRALRPGSKLAAIVFGRPEQNPLQWLPTVLARRAVGLPAPALREPGMFALGEPGALETAFRGGGFREVCVERHTTSRRYRSASDAVRGLRDTLPSVHALLSRLDEESRERTWTEIELALTDLEGPAGLVAPGEFLIGVGTKGPSEQP